jgi:L-alanine-DL-glutamate epimerase-like enolase superfamily enzyme
VTLICSKSSSSLVPVKLESITTHITSPPAGIGGGYWLLVEVTTDDGITGVGECYGIPFGPDVARAMVVDLFDRFLAGDDPHHVEAMFRRAYSAGFTQRPDVSLMGAFSGVEMACWDIVGKSTGRPVYQLLGGLFHPRLRTYTYLYPPSAHDSSLDPADDPDVYHDGDAAAAQAEYYLELGFTAVKQDPTGPYAVQGGRELSMTELARSEYNTARLRRAVGDRADLLFGTHGQMTTSSAIRLARRLEPFDPLWFEEPCPPDQMGSLARIAQSTSIPVATGERLTTRGEFHAALTAGATIIQPNVGRAGGIWEMRKIAAVAELYNAQLAPHIYCGPVAYAAAAHVAHTCPNFLILETIHTDFHRDVVVDPLPWSDGYLEATDRAGLGLELNHEVIAAHPYRVDRPLHLTMTQAPVPSDNPRLTTDFD